MSEFKENAINLTAQGIINLTALRNKLATDPRYNNVIMTLDDNSAHKFVEGTYEELAGYLANDGSGTLSFKDMYLDKNADYPSRLTGRAAIIREYQRGLLHGNAQRGYAGSTRIYLHSGGQELDGRHYALEDTVIKMSFVGNDDTYICRREDGDPFGIVTIGDNCQSDRKDAYFDYEGYDLERNEYGGCIELSTFCMLSVLGRTKDGIIGLYTAYSRQHNILFTEFVTGSPDLRAGQLSSRARLISSDAYGYAAVELLMGLVRAAKSEDNEQDSADDSLNSNGYLEFQFSEVGEMLAFDIVAERPPEPSWLPESYNPGGWPVIPAKRAFGQPSAQDRRLDEIKATGDGIYEMADMVLGRNAVEIRFSDNTVSWNDRNNTSYYLKNIAMEAKFAGDADSHRVIIGKDDFMSAIAVLGYDALTDKPQGFLLTERDGKSYIWELDEFTLAAAVDNDPSSYANFDEWEALDENRIYFACFNKTRELLYTGTPKADGGLFIDVDNDADTAGKAN